LLKKKEIKKKKKKQLRSCVYRYSVMKLSSVLPLNQAEGGM